MRLLLSGLRHPFGSRGRSFGLSNRQTAAERSKCRLSPAAQIQSADRVELYRGPALHIELEDFKHRRSATRFTDDISSWWDNQDGAAKPFERVLVRNQF